MILTAHAFNFSSLTKNYPKKTLDIPVKELREHGFHDKRELINDICSYALKMITDDIIENNVRFNLPSIKESYIQLKGIHGDDFINARKNGAFREVDPFKSNFSGYMLTYNFQNNKRVVTKPIYVEKARKAIITKKTNEGGGKY